MSGAVEPVAMTPAYGPSSSVGSVLQRDEQAVAVP